MKWQEYLPEGCLRGRIAWVLLTGPSLVELNGALIHDEDVVFAANGAPAFGVRADLYFVSAVSFLEENLDFVSAVTATTAKFLVETDNAGIYTRLKSPTTNWLSLDWSEPPRFVWQHGCFNPDLTGHFYCGPTVLLDFMAPLLLWLRPSLVILAGADYNSSSRHFHDDCESQITVVRNLDISDEFSHALLSMKIFARECTARGIQAVVLSTQSSIRVFPTLDCSALSTLLVDWRR